MCRLIVRCVLVFLLLSEVFTLAVLAQDEGVGKNARLPVQYEELTAPQFVDAVAASRGVCMIPLGILEKHGPHLPLGTDLINCRETALRAAHTEYCVVFPEYYVGQIFEARHQPGTIAYSNNLMWLMLQETCDELARNGFKKIVLVNGHGGNNNFLRFFCQSQLATDRNYVVALFAPERDSSVEQKARGLRKTTTGGHADEVETSMLLVHRPELVHLEKAATESGADQHRLAGLPYVFTGIWWYARYPNHYAGDGRNGDRELGELYLASESRQLAEMIKAIKADRTIGDLQRQFQSQAKSPTPDRK